MKVAMLIVAAIAVSVAIPSVAHSGWTFEITETGMMDGHDGYYMTLENPSEPILETDFYIEQADSLWLYAIQAEEGEPWEVLDPSYARKPKSLSIGQEWLELDDQGTVLIVTVVDGGTVSTQVGDFDSFRVMKAPQSDPGSPQSYEWFSDGLGLVASEEIGDESYVLTEYQVDGGTGCLPLAVGNRWVYTEVDHIDYIPTAIQTVSWGLVKTSFSP